jgi:phosphoglycolate phosphatase-like HAD superfamily hydrolase
LFVAIQQLGKRLQMRVSANAPIVALDIDGTLAKYYSHFHWFAEMYTQRTLSPQWNRNYRGEFSEALGLDKELYRQIKLAYRQGGMKRCIPVMPNAGELVRGLRRKGIAVWITTTRPWNRLDNIDPDTSFWIERNLGRVDGVIYGEDKYQDLLEIVGSRPVLGIVDDLPENTLKARALGLETILVSGDHNEWWTETGSEPVHLHNLLFVAKHINEQWIRPYKKAGE